MFIFCGFYRFNIQAKSKENRFFIKFYGLGVNFCAIIYKFKRLCCQSVNYMLLNGRISGLLHKILWCLNHFAEWLFKGQLVYRFYGNG